MNAPSFSLQGRVALVTGAGRGLGREIAAAFAAAGAHVLVNGRNADTCDAVAGQLREAGFDASPLVFDVGDGDAVEAAIAYVEREYGRLDILVNNVGSRLRQPLEAITPELFAGHLQVNLTAAFRLARRVAPLMARRHWGRILMITSIVAQLGRAGDAAYIAAKGGLSALTRAFAVEFGGDGITCNAIAPGSFATEINRVSMTPAVRARLEGRTPLRRVGEPAEIAGPALLLASDAGSFVTGQILTVDGGYGIAF